VGPFTGPVAPLKLSLAPPGSNL